MAKPLTVARRAFTLIELVLIIAIILMLAAILFPVIAQTKQQGYITTALSQMKELAQSVMLYNGDSDGRLVPSTNYGVAESQPGRIWAPLLKPYAGSSERIFIAPNTEGKFAKNWLERSFMTVGMNSASAFDKKGCKEETGKDYTGCRAFSEAASFDASDKPASVPLFSITPGGPLADRYLGYEFNPYNGVPSKVKDQMKTSPPLVSDRDLVRELKALPAELIKPVYCRYLSTGHDEGFAPVIFADGSAKSYPAKHLQSAGAGIYWRFR